MAIARVGAWLNTQDGTTRTSWQVTTTTIANVRDFLVAIIAFDNCGTSGAAPTLSIADSKGNVWTQAGSVNRTAASATNDGTTCFIFYCPVKNTIPVGETITMTISPTCPSKAISIDRFTGVKNVSPQIGSATTATGSSAVPTATTGSLTSGNLCVGAVAQEGNNASTYTEDTDTTNGSWVSFTAIGTTGGSSTANQKIGGASKILSATGAQTYNPAITSGDWAEVIVEFGAGTWTDVYDLPSLVQTQPARFRASVR